MFFMEDISSLLKNSKERRVRARGLHNLTGNHGICRPGAPTGRFLQQAASYLDGGRNRNSPKLFVSIQFAIQGFHQIVIAPGGVAVFTSLSALLNAAAGLIEINVIIVAKPG